MGQRVSRRRRSRLKWSFMTTMRRHDAVVIPASGNTAPEIDELAIRQPIDEGGLTYLSGTFIDPDLTDAHTIIVDWGDGTVDEWNLRIGGRTNRQVATATWIIRNWDRPTNFRPIR